jgi:vacuolar protein sorting-associated protein 13A/C
LVITEEQKQEFYDVIDYDADKAAIAASVDLPKDVSCSLRMIIIG